jgi:hypothetical protein
MIFMLFVTNDFFILSDISAAYVGEVTTCFCVFTFSLEYPVMR